MPVPQSLGRLCAAAVVALAAAHQARAQSAQAIDYSISLPAPARHFAHVRAQFPTGAQPALDLFIPTWTPGIYAAEDHATRVDSVSARAADGAPLPVHRTRTNHWQVETRGAATVTVTYRLRADGRDPGGNWVGDSEMVLNGRATYLSTASASELPAHVALALPAGWTSLSSLDTAADRAPDHYRASSYAELADAPIVAGRLETVQFDVAGATHMLVDVGAPAGFSGERAGRALLRLVVEVQRFWGFLPYPRYEFFNIFRRGAGGPGHINATILSAAPDVLDTPEARQTWLGDAARGYFRAFNGTRLHPAEFAPPDYDARPASPSRWITEGLGTYYGELLLERAGLAPQQDFLDGVSRLIARAQNDPARRAQSLTAASLDAGKPSRPGRALDWVARGAVVGLLLDAHLRSVTNGAKSLDDVMRLAYQRYSGTAGYTDQQFRGLVSEVAGSDQSEWLADALDTTGELDYKELLGWYGLQFTDGRRWQLDVVEVPKGGPPVPKDTSANAPPTPAQQQQHLQALLKPDAGPAPGPGPGPGSG